MLKVGLTGGIGSGKTTVAKIFELLGVPVFDADSEAKNIMQNDDDLIQLIKEEFGEAAYLQGILNRPYIAGIVFNDPFRLEKLNALVHPSTLHAATQWMEKQSTPYIIKEAALLFEAGSAANLDYVIGVSAPKALRMKRVMGREQVTRELVLERMNRQIDETIKMKLCDFVITNDEQHLLMPQVISLHEKLLSLA
jgi:dephospho-CoA kinase